MTKLHRAGVRALGLLAPPLPAGPWASLAILALRFAGAVAAFAWLKSPLGPYAPPAAGAVATLVGAVAGLRGAHRWLRLATWPARAADVLLHLLWFLVALVFGSVLAWAVPAWVPWAVLALALAVVAGAGFRSGRRIPLVLPVGLWILACVYGWGNEDGRVRCDDYLRVKDLGTPRVVVPTHSALEGCVPGDSLRVPRYPRRVWEPPDGGRIVFTTQPGIFPLDPDEPPLDVELSGSVCEAPLDGSRSPRCFGAGKAEGMVESERHDRLFVAAWGQTGPGKRGAVYAFPRRGPLEPAGAALLDRPSVELFYEPEDDTLGVFSDDARVMQVVGAADLVPDRAPVAAPFDPGDVFYDAGRGEGVLCYSPGLARTLDGGAAALVAFRGHPFQVRGLAPSSEYPWAWLSIVWGCEFDPVARRAWAAVADLGLLLTLDYDSGAVLDRRFIGMGMRSMALDAARHRLYVANFLRGDVVSYDLGTGAEAGRWFAGRFVRGLRLSRDGRSLWVGSNLGVLSISLEAVPPS